MENQNVTKKLNDMLYNLSEIKNMQSQIIGYPITHEQAILLAQVNNALNEVEAQQYHICAWIYADVKRRVENND